MAQLVTIIGITHNPFMPRLFQQPQQPPGAAKVKERIATMRHKLAEAHPDVLVTIAGRMQIRGQERPMVVPSRVRFKDDKLVWVRGEAQLRMSDFGIDPPARMLVKVGDALLVSFDVLLAPGD